MHPQGSTAIVPDATVTDDQARRAWHRDIHELDDDEIRAELELVRHEWARAVYHRRRGHVVRGGPDVSISAREWLRARGERLRAELERRRR